MTSSAIPEGFDFTDITYHRHVVDGVPKPTVRIAFDRPEVRNAFRPHTVDELYRVLDHARMSNDVGVILLTGNGPSEKDGGWAFCSGGDQRIRGRTGYQYAAGETADTVDPAQAGRLHILEVQRLIRFMPKPVICLVNGWAAGGGVEAAADLGAQRLRIPALVEADVEHRPRLGRDHVGGAVADVDRREFQVRGVEMRGAAVQRLGDEGRGVRTIIEMVAATRLDCVLGSAALMRHALAEASWHVAHRSAFGGPLVDKPLMQNVVADLAVESEAATALAMRLAAAVDRPHDPQEVALRAAEMMQSGQLFSDMGASLARVLAGFVLGAAVAVPVGFLMGWYPTARGSIDMPEVTKNTGIRKPKASPSNFCSSRSSP